MNICFYTDFTISGMTGGIGRITSVLTDGFRHQFGWKVFSIHAFDAKADCTLTETDGAIRLRLHDRMNVHRELRKNYPKACDFIRSNAVDIVIIQTSMDVVGKLRKALDKEGLSSVKVISVLHYTPGTDEFGSSYGDLWQSIRHGKCTAKDLAKGLIAPLYNKIQHRATIKAYQNAYWQGDRLVLLSPSYIQIFKQLAGIADADPIRLLAVPNCIPFEYDMSEAEISAKRKTALMVGRMADNPKRVTEILHIWQQIEQDEEGQKWNLEIVGDGPDLEAFRQKAQELGLQHCSFEGRQNPVEYYRHSSIFLMTSAFEGFPMTLCEAQQMACVPVVYDSFASLPEVVTDGVNGRIVKNMAREQFVNTLLSLIKEPAALCDMMHAAVQSCQRYKQPQILSEWKQLLTHLN